MKEMCFIWKYTSKNVSRYFPVILTIALIVLLTLPTLPIALASEADAESTSSPELVETQTVSFAAASTRSPADPFSMIIMNDPQFFWLANYDPGKLPSKNLYRKAACEEQMHKVNAISHIWHNSREPGVPDEPENYGQDVERWPSADDLGSNLAFDSQSQNRLVAAPLQGVIINGDLTFVEQDAWGIRLSEPRYKWTVQDIEWFYRDYYVTYLNERCPGLKVYAGFGNHDTKWTKYDLACALTLGEEYNDPGGNKATDNKERKWINFPTSGISVDFNETTKSGSLSYSWEVGNYHFVQINDAPYDLRVHDPKDPLQIPYVLNLGSKWLNGMKVTDPFYLWSWGTGPTAANWLKRDLYYATRDGMKIVINYHGSEDTLGPYLRYGNVVALFKGHADSRSQSSGLAKYSGWENAWGQNVPIFQAGHSGWDGSTFYTDHQLLIAEFANDYINVGLVDCGDWSGSGGAAFWFGESDPEKMMTVKWVNTAPVVTGLESVSSPVYEGLDPGELVAQGHFTDGSIVTSYPLVLDEWDMSKVDWGDNSQTPLSYTDSGEGKYSFDLIHAYGDDGSYTIKVSVTDSQGKSRDAQCEVTVLNVDPSFIWVGPQNPTIFKGAPVTVEATFFDPGYKDTHDATVAWGDGDIDDAQILYDEVEGRLRASHTYSTPGSYNYTVTVNDDDEGSCSMSSQITVIVALSGFVTDEYYDKPLAGVTITCGGETTTTDAGGYYEITPLNPGEHSVEMTKLGYNSIVPSKPATIILGQETIVNFTAYPLPGMMVTKETVDTERLAGDTITYDITVDNQGDGPAINIVITDVLPSMTTFIFADPPATTNGQTLTWSIDTLSEHTSTTINLTVRISLLIYPDTRLNNPVTVDFDDLGQLPQTPKDAAATTVILPTVPTENVQGVGYWRHQVKAVQANKPCDYTASELLLLLEKIRVSSQVFETVSTLENAADLLATPTGKDTMETRATQQLLALWLNLAARAVAADTPLDLADVTTASTIAEALTQCETILLDPTPTKASCECSKEICDLLNNCKGLPW